MLLRFSWTEAAGMRGFGELEQAIMDLVWSIGEPVTVREVLERLNSERPQPLAYNTVHTVTEVLHRKGWLSRAKDGRAFRYEATRSREEYAASLIDQVWATGADRTATLVKLFDEMDADEVAELRAALAARTEEDRV
ncbi:BlaI/MecI/CopY family transcriptional regulator [Streptomyces chiangmaiensis]|uniref:BlaI/MecI/CopY family transcriptional regulator n=1 Tax=Streptomyces chiangmaiensis TaxID=766497 RepID=A0ABU7FUH1_9ACTN|nr:BlaI/MecI/CopY family transcriptional regulator [Streptomyces chiangmaiensis]MED7827745.1 BlaI/MecI/CopY family transcriptional regulator [Streptomyces chiangmaiensis]